MTAAPYKELQQAKEACPTTSRRLLEQGALLVDVRERGEVDAAGFGGCETVNIPMSEFEARWPEIPRDRDVILACRIGERSLKATYFLMYQGYERVMNMQHGMERWAARGFPVIGNGTANAAQPTIGTCCNDDLSAHSERDCGCSGGNCC